MDIAKKLGQLAGWLVIAAVASGATAQPRGEDQPRVDRMSVAVSILPQAWFVERVGGDLVEVMVLVGPGHSPATYEPTPQQMTELQRAHLFVGAGVPFEEVLLPRVRDLNEGPYIIGPQPVGTVDAHHGGGHRHGDFDPHTWLDPRQAMALTDLIAAALIERMPDRADVLGQNLDQTRAELMALDAQIQQLLSPARGRAFFVFHPAFGHFAATYGVQQIALETEGKEPSARQITLFIEQAQAAGAKMIIVQPQFSSRAAEAVARDVGAELVNLDPLARDYAPNLLHMAEVVAKAAIVLTEPAE